MHKKKKVHRLHGLPEVVCLCGSTRFIAQFREQNLKLTLEGKIVLSIGCDTRSDESIELTEEEKKNLDDLHLRKIDLCDRILVLNVGGYVGESTANEISYAASQGKGVTFYKQEMEKMLAVPAVLEEGKCPFCKEFISNCECDDEEDF